VQQRQELSAYAQLLAGLRFDKTLIRQIFREGIMRESVIYQEILQEGELKGKAEGKTEEARSLILRLLTRKFGTLPASVEAQVQTLALLQLEALGEALLDFAELGDLSAWLRGNE
jgi:predicted transposase YdaD